MIDRAQRNIAFLVAGCFFMEILDGTIVVTATPKIADAFGAAPEEIAIVVTAYLVTVAALIPLSAWLTLRHGYRVVFLVAIVVFTLGSAGCAISDGVWELTGWRVLQGVGGAMMVPVGRMLVLDRAEKSQIMRLTAYLVWPALTAPVVAPLIGGLITTYASWRWLFLVNIPLGVVAFACALRVVHGRPAQSPPRLDRLGFALTCGGLGGLPIAAHLASGEHPPWGWVALATAASVVLLAAAVRHLLRAETPLLDLRTLRVPTFANAQAGSALTHTVIGATPFLLPLLFQTVFDWNPVKSGAVVMALFAGNVLAKFTTRLLYGRLGFRSVLTAATALLAVTVVLCGLLTRDTPVPVIVVLLFFSGAFRSIAMTGYWTLAFEDVPDDQMRDANALASTNQQLFTGLAVAVASVALRLGDAIGSVLPGEATARSAFVVAFLLISLLSVAATAVARRLHETAGVALAAA